MKQKAEMGKMENKNTLSLFVFIDAFGWELYKKYGFLDGMIKTSSPLGTVLGYSATCVPTILTGKKPEEHGHFSFFYFDPKNTPFRFLKWLKYLPASLVDRGRVRNVLSKLIKKVFGYTGYFQLYNTPFEYLPFFDYSEKRDLYVKDGINSSDKTIFDYLDDEAISYHVSDWQGTEDMNIESLKSDIARQSINFAYLYLANMDGLLHAHGTDSDVIDNKIRWYENKLLELEELAYEHYDDVRIHVFSDHGMKDVIHHHNMIKNIEALGLTFGTDYVAFYDSTMARFWFQSETAQKEIELFLVQQTYGRILSEQELAEFGCQFKNNLYGELIYLLEPGHIICPSFMGKKPVAGMHGYSPEDLDSVALYATNTETGSIPNDLTEMCSLMLNEAKLARKAA